MRICLQRYIELRGCGLTLIRCNLFERQLNSTFIELCKLRDLCTFEFAVIEIVFRIFVRVDNYAVNNFVIACNVEFS